MITQEMVDVLAMVVDPMAFEPDDGSAWEVGYITERLIKARNTAEEALTAVYPLILEQAASAIKAQRLAPTDATSKAHNHGLTAAIAAIRNLKDKTDAQV